VRTAIKLVAFLLFFVSAGSMIFAGFSYGRYRELLPQTPAVGVFTWIRAWFPVTDRLDGTSVSDECRQCLKRYRVWNTVGFCALALFILFAVSLRAFGLQTILQGE